MQRRPSGGSRSARPVRQPGHADHARGRGVRVGRSRIRFRVRDLPCECSGGFRGVPRGAAVGGRHRGGGALSAAWRRARRPDSARSVGAATARSGILRGDGVRRLPALAGAAARLHRAGGPREVTRADGSRGSRRGEPAGPGDRPDVHGVRYPGLPFVQECRRAGQGGGGAYRHLRGHPGAGGRPRLGRPRHSQAGVRFAPLPARYRRVRERLRHRFQHRRDRPHDRRRQPARDAQPVRERGVRRGLLLFGGSRSGVRVPIQSR